MKVYIYCGVPGSGKSTLVSEHHPDAIVCSADHHFVGDDGVYRFDPRQLPEAHGACLRKFAGYAAIGGPGELVVDNTNTTVAEIAPYAAFALAYGHELLVVTVECDPAIAAARNTHGVPEAAVVRMAATLAKRELPPWWPHDVVRTSTPAKPAINDDQIKELYARGGIDVDTAHVALHGRPDEQDKARAACTAAWAKLVTP